MSDMHNESQAIREAAKADAAKVASVLKSTETFDTAKTFLQSQDPRVILAIAVTVGFILGRRSKPNVEFAPSVIG